VTRVLGLLYKAFAELGKAIKTIFLSRYLHGEALRREIHEDLNVAKQWNSATDFVFFARRGELVSNRREERGQHVGAALATEFYGLYQHTNAAVDSGKVRMGTPRDFAALSLLIGST
jgi:Tn3 transposase DDE domain